MWLYNKVSEETAEKYISALDKYIGGKIITSPSQISRIYAEVTDKSNFSKGFRNFLNFLVEREIIDEAIALKFKKAVPIPKTKADRQFLDLEDVLEAVEYFKRELSRDHYLVFLLLLYSGMRLRQILRVLAEFDPRHLHVFPARGFARYELSHVSRGHKEGFWLYMPIWVAEMLRKVELSEDSVKKAINYKASSGRLISAKYIRKWFNNLLVRIGIEKDIRNFIMGRSGEISRVEGDHYLELLNLADFAYEKVLKEFPIDKEVLRKE